MFLIIALLSTMCHDGSASQSHRSLSLSLSGSKTDVPLITPPADGQEVLTPLREKLTNKSVGRVNYNKYSRVILALLASSLAVCSGHLTNDCNEQTIGTELVETAHYASPTSSNFMEAIKDIDLSALVSPLAASSAQPGGDVARVDQEVNRFRFLDFLFQETSASSNAGHMDDDSSDAMAVTETQESLTDPVEKLDYTPMEPGTFDEDIPLSRDTETVAPESIQKVPTEHSEIANIIGNILGCALFVCGLRSSRQY